MGFSLKRAVKKVTKGIKKAFKSVGKIFKKVGKALKSGFKKLTSSTFGKVLLAVAAIYVAGALYGAYGAGASTVPAGSSAWAPKVAFQNAAKMAGLGKTPVPADPGTAQAAAQTANAAKGATELTAVGGEVAGSAATEGISAGAQEILSAGAEGGFTSSSGNIVNQSLGSGYTQQGLSITPEASTGVLGKAKAAGKAASTWAKDNPLLAYGGMQAAGSAIASANSPDEEDILQKQYDLRAQEQQRLVDNNKVPNISTNLLGAYRFRSPADAAIDPNSPRHDKQSPSGLLTRSEYV